MEWSQVFSFLKKISPISIILLRSSLQKSELLGKSCSELIVWLTPEQIVLPMKIWKVRTVYTNCAKYCHVCIDFIRKWSVHSQIHPVIYVFHFSAVKHYLIVIFYTYFISIKVNFDFLSSSTFYIQLWKMNFIPLVNKPYVNEVTLN